VTAPGAPPQPRPDVDTAGWWRATAEGTLAICRCVDCGVWQHPPLERCRHCGGALSYEAVAGTGALHSFIVVHQPVAPGYLDQLPYVVGLIELDEQEALRIPARVVGSAREDLRIGDRMTAEVIALPGGDYHVAVFHRS